MTIENRVEDGLDGAAAHQQVRCVRPVPQAGRAQRRETPGISRLQTTAGIQQQPGDLNMPFVGRQMQQTPPEVGIGQRLRFPGQNPAQHVGPARHGRRDGVPLGSLGFEERHRVSAVGLDGDEQRELPELIGVVDQARVGLQEGCQGLHVPYLCRAEDVGVRVESELGKRVSGVRCQAKRRFAGVVGRLKASASRAQPLEHVRGAGPGGDVHRGIPLVIARRNVRLGRSKAVGDTTDKEQWFVTAERRQVMERCPPLVIL